MPAAVAEHLEGQPQRALKEFYAATEEARADLVALYFIAEPRMAEFGLVPTGGRTCLCTNLVGPLAAVRRPWRRG